MCPAGSDSTVRCPAVIRTQWPELFREAAYHCLPALLDLVEIVAYVCGKYLGFIVRWLWNKGTPIKSSKVKFYLIMQYVNTVHDDYDKISLGTKYTLR